MIPVAIAMLMVAWLIVAAVVAGLCASAAAGDRALAQTLPRRRHVARRAQQELEVEPERPVGHVEVVDPDHLLHRHARAEHLPGTGHAGREVQPAAVEAEHLRVLVGDERPRADEAHLAAQHVEELRQLVERGAAQEVADAGDARVAR